MSVLAAIQSASVRLNQARPQAAFPNSSQYAGEMSELANEAAIAIAKAVDWRKLHKLYVFSGTGQAQFPFPADYDRMPLKASMFSTRSRMPLVQARDLDHWLQLQILPVVGYPGRWIITGGHIELMPALMQAEEIKFYYITKNIVVGDKARFTADNDEFMLSERLLTLGIVWRWRALKGLDYSEDMKNYDIALSEEAGRDKGSRVIAIGDPRIPSGVDLAYPGTLLVAP
jgi:hypothetical protein